MQFFQTIHIYSMKHLVEPRGSTFSIERMFAMCLLPSIRWFFVFAFLVSNFSSLKAMMKPRIKIWDKFLFSLHKLLLSELINILHFLLLITLFAFENMCDKDAQSLSQEYSNTYMWVVRIKVIEEIYHLNENLLTHMTYMHEPE